MEQVSKSRRQARESSCPADGALQGGSHRRRILSPKVKSHHDQSWLQSHREVIGVIARVQAHLDIKGLLCLFPIRAAVWGRAYLCSVRKLLRWRLRFPDNHCFCHQHVGVLLLGLLYRHSKGLQGPQCQRSHNVPIPVTPHVSHLMLVHVIIPRDDDPLLNPSLRVASFHSLRNE